MRVSELACCKQASVLHHSEIQAALQSIAEKTCLLTTPSLLSRGTRNSKRSREPFYVRATRLGDVASMIETQGIRTGTVSMLDSVSGLTISHPKVGPFIVLNDRHSPERRRFSWCHEYAHVLIDKDVLGMVSRESERNDLREVGPNIFSSD